MSSCLHESLSRPIDSTSQTMRNFSERLLKPFGLTSEQFHLLKNVTLGHGLSQSALCELVGKNPANISRILDRLESKGLVKRCENPNDRRTSLVFQTASGHILVSEVSSMFTAISMEIEQDISPQDRAVFKYVLKRITTNLDRLLKRHGD